MRVVVVLVVGGPAGRADSGSLRPERGSHSISIPADQLRTELAGKSLAQVARRGKSATDGDRAQNAAHAHRPGGQRRLCPTKALRRRPKRTSASTNSSARRCHSLGSVDGRRGEPSQRITSGAERLPRQVDGLSGIGRRCWRQPQYGSSSAAPPASAACILGLGPIGRDRTHSDCRGFRTRGSRHGSGSASTTGSSLLVFGLLGMAGIWLILPGPGVHGQRVCGRSARNTSTETRVRPRHTLTTSSSSPPRGCRVPARRRTRRCRRPRGRAPDRAGAPQCGPRPGSSDRSCRVLL